MHSIAQLALVLIQLDSDLSAKYHDQYLEQQGPIIQFKTAFHNQAHLFSESIRQCKHYPNPKNGQVVCDSLFRLFCTPECDDEFDFEFKPAVVYMCGPMTGEWFTYPKGEKVPWPDCVKRLR